MSHIPLTLSSGWADYELIDSGNFEKLERFGNYITIRPEPQAVWAPAFDQHFWEKEAHVRFQGTGSHSGKWIRLKPMPDNWNITYQLPKGPKLTFKLALTGFKHVGIFPEQHLNWDFIFKKLNGQSGARFLNVFAYTGGASLAARAAGAETYHVDSIRQVVNWGRQNMELSGLTDIRWVLEDALKFVKREVKRGKKYEGIIMDPPAFGHGPKGESWKLETMIGELTESAGKLVNQENGFLILNTYSLGFSSTIMQNLLHQNLSRHSRLQCGELGLLDRHRRILPLGVLSVAEWGNE